LNVANKSLNLDRKSLRPGSFDERRAASNLRKGRLYYPVQRDTRKQAKRRSSLVRSFFVNYAPDKSDMPGVLWSVLTVQTSGHCVDRSARSCSIAFIAFVRSWCSRRSSLMVVSGGTCCRIESRRDSALSGFGRVLIGCSASVSKRKGHPRRMALFKVSRRAG